MDLKWLLVRRITLVALACSRRLGDCALRYGPRVEAAERRPGGTRRPPAQSATLAHRPIDRRGDTLSRLEHGRGALSALRPVHRISRCVCRRAANELRRRRCRAAQSAGVVLRRLSLAYQRSAYGRARYLVPRYRVWCSCCDIRSRSRPQGEAWSTIAPLLGLSAALVAALCLMTYFVVDRALLPAKDILAGLNRLARGDLSCRLPAFHLAELNRISEVFNVLSEDLSKVTAERRELGAQADRLAGTGAASSRARTARRDRAEACGAQCAGRLRADQCATRYARAPQ